MLKIRWRCRRAPLQGCAVIGVGLALMLTGCGDNNLDGSGGTVKDAGPVKDAGQVSDATINTTMPLCRPALGSEILSPRVDVLAMVGASPSTTPVPKGIKVRELFDRFKTNCGACHVDATNGGRHTSEATFSANVDRTWLERIKTDDLTKVMPPLNVAYSSRPETDPVRQLVFYLEAWLSQGSPTDVFFIDAPPSGSELLSYAYSSMSNIGNCVPNQAAYAVSDSDEMASKDEMFADAEALPDNLSETDLTTFDSDVLAANGVIAYVPTYPLWSDGSGKLRHIRVPKGTHVKFDKQKQTFEIPPNTRFYKTFFRKVVDGAGHESHRKIETRLIVTRPDTVDADGNPKPNALFGTYLWSEDEMTATLRTTPYRDGTPFTDATLEYATDEGAYHDLINAVGNGSSTTLGARVANELAKPENSGLVRHYAVPGSIRCVQCHQGSPTNNFALGFFPLQIAQRADGTGGKYEKVGDDEINQLQRFIDYGLITGMTSPADVVTLEESQRPRVARTEQELTAQAYLVGNCAHCHNTRGFPSLAKPELSSALNFMPSAGKDGGGIFEFSFEKVSPIRQRGAFQDVPIPYITPSLRDYPVANSAGIRMDTGTVLATVASGGEATWTPKYAIEAENVSGEYPLACADPKFRAEPTNRPYCGERTHGRTFVAAPWRSLIYRNVDTPFPYFDDFVPFPHMPMNSSGFDCRAPRIMGDWMVSLPALQKFPLLYEDALPLATAKRDDGSYDTSPQPYREVTPSDPEYAAAVAGAKARLKEYHEGVRYNYCQDVLGGDILDTIPTGSSEVLHYRPDPKRYLAGGIPPMDPKNPDQYVQPALGVPYHAEWFNYDPTDEKGLWQPRRASAWKDILQDGHPDQNPPAGLESSFTASDVADRARDAAAVAAATLTPELLAYATTETPFALWQVADGCKAKLSTARTLASFTAGERPAWMDVAAKTASGDAPVYMTSPGAALYRNICFNCHGPKADGKGLQGDALAASSEGEARPANFVKGLFGPPEMPGDNIKRVFGDDKWASRYMAWMALGGTLQLIPKDVIHQVEATRVFGARRNGQMLGVGGSVSANMLNLAKGICGSILPTHALWEKVKSAPGGRSPDGGFPLLNQKDSPLIASNGDRDMWLNLCSRFNESVVRVYGVRTYDDIPRVELLDLYYADTYPATAAILDHNLVVQMGVNGNTNFQPACVIPDVVGSKAGDATQTFQSWSHMPACPDAFLANPKTRKMQARVERVADGASFTEKYFYDDEQRWVVNGAANAGFAVFSYLKKADLANNKPKPFYNECPTTP